MAGQKRGSWPRRLTDWVAVLNRRRRTIALGERVVDVLRLRRHAQTAHRELVGDAWEEGDFVFTSAVGTPLDDSNVRRAFQSMLKRAGLPRIRFHDLRHTHATLMLAQGVHPKIVSERLGHATIGITLDTYSHVLPNLQHEAARALDDYLVAHRPVEDQPVTPDAAMLGSKMAANANGDEQKAAPRGAVLDSKQWHGWRDSNPRPAVLEDDWVGATEPFHEP